MMSNTDFDKIWIDGYVEWIQYWNIRGWKPYYVNIMFSPMVIGPSTSLGPQKHITVRMKSIIEDGLYPRLAGIFTRHPRQKREHDRLPKMILFPDISVPKKDKKVKLEKVIINESLHYNGALLAPPISRLKRDLVAVVQEKQEVFQTTGVERFHVKPLDYTPKRCVDYTVKTVRHGRASEEDLIALPRVKSEVASSPITCDSGERLIKDIISSTNLSEGVVRRMTGNRRPPTDRTKRQRRH